MTEQEVIFKLKVRLNCINSLIQSTVLSPKTENYFAIIDLCSKLPEVTEPKHNTNSFEQLCRELHLFYDFDKASGDRDYTAFSTQSAYLIYKHGRV